MSENRHTIRNLDRELVIEARVHALQTGRSTLGELVTDAIELLIEQETVDEGDGEMLVTA
jgi:plasmid stability protein